MKLTEKILIAVAIAGLLLRVFDIPGNGILTTLVSLLLSILYLLFSFALLSGATFKTMFRKSAYPGVSAWRIIMSVLVGVVLCLLVWTVLFRVMLWPGGRVMLFMAMGLTIPISLVCFTVFAKAGQFLKRVFVRVGILTFLCLALFYMPAATLLKIFKTTPEMEHRVLQDERRL